MESSPQTCPKCGRPPDKCGCTFTMAGYEPEQETKPPDQALRDEIARLRCLIYDAMQFAEGDAAILEVLKESGIDPESDCPTCGRCTTS